MLLESTLILDSYTFYQSVGGYCIIDQTGNTKTITIATIWNLLRPICYLIYIIYTLRGV